MMRVDITYYNGTVDLMMCERVVRNSGIRIETRHSGKTIYMTEKYLKENVMYVTVVYSGEGHIIYKRGVMVH